MRRGSSPHTRGARARGGRRASRGRIIPAYAGSTRLYANDVRLVQDHPRIRGEHPDAERHDPRGNGSSPHTRGARCGPGPQGTYRRIIPAYAGSTRSVWSIPLSCPDHPRIRGEHLPLKTFEGMNRGSSPHTRGAHVAVERRFDRCRIIPAYAGSTSSRQPVRGSGRDHPRIRGEHSAEANGTLRAYGSSPHTRGARHRRPVGGGWRGIIPAYAGSTCGPGRRGACGADHPRIRGEHPYHIIEVPAEYGSSPHTRGAPPNTETLSNGRRIIPAYAGSTSGRRVMDCPA